MIVVIQCAAGKQRVAGALRTPEGNSVLFVADPGNAPPQRKVSHARPDDLAYGNKTWRQHLINYNKQPGNNPLGLLPAFEFYSNDTYRRLVTEFGIEGVYILSAGWGLISASFLTPVYDITFSGAAERYKRREREKYADFRMLPEDYEGEVVFLGGKNYIPLFCALTDQSAGRRTIFYNSDTAPNAPGCKLKKYETKIRTNWHYKCADDLINKELST